MSIEIDEFVSVVEPALATNEPDVLAEAISERWTAEEVCSLLRHEHARVRRLAAAAAGVVGECGCSQCLVTSLHDEDPEVHSTAEHAIWQVWFHCCKPEASAPFQIGVAYLENDNLVEAIECFQECRKLDPKFAEAYHQCAIAHYLQGNYDQAIADCEHTLTLVPIHFGAMAQLGHCRMQQGQWAQALEAYRSALRINPHMPGLDVVVEKLSRKVSNGK